MSVVIEAQNISKRFFLGEPQSDDFSGRMDRVYPACRIAFASAKKTDSTARASTGILAVRDVFIRGLPGQTLAIIGENGAGKSTL